MREGSAVLASSSCTHPCIILAAHNMFETHNKLEHFERQEQATRQYFTVGSLSAYAVDTCLLF